MRRFAKIAGFVVLVGAVTLLFLLPGLLRLVGVRHFRVPAPSMEPAITTGDRIVTTPTSDPERGEIIVFNPPVEADGVSEECVTEQALCARPGSERSELLFVKRVVAREGDRVAMDDGRVVLNGRLQREPYVDAGACTSGCSFPSEITVPQDHLYVLGDNRAASYDSRFWGPVPTDWVIGKARLRYWPPDHFGTP